MLNLIGQSVDNLNDRCKTILIVLQYESSEIQGNNGQYGYSRGYSNWWMTQIYFSFYTRRVMDFKLAEQDDWRKQSCGCKYLSDWFVKKEKVLTADESFLK